MTYLGDGFISDTTFSFLVTNYQNPLDQMYFTASRPYIHPEKRFLGFWVGLTFESVTPVCMKALVSEEPIEDRQELIEQLTVTPAELAYFRKKDKFMLQNSD